MRAKLRLGFCQVWYPLFGVLMLAVGGPAARAILTRTPLMQVGLGDFYHHVGAADGGAGRDRAVAELAGLAAAADGAGVSWEMALFQLCAGRGRCSGCMHAVGGRISGRDFGFKVTPKGAHRCAAAAGQGRDALPRARAVSPRSRR